MTLLIVFICHFQQPRKSIKTASRSDLHTLTPLVRSPFLSLYPLRDIRTSKCPFLSFTDGRLAEALLDRDARQPSRPSRRKLVKDFDKEKASEVKETQYTLGVLYLRCLFRLQVASLQMKIEARSMDYVSDWERGKPVGGDLRPSDALQTIQMFETRYVRLKEERDNVAKAKEALELDESSGGDRGTADKLGVGWEELQDLKGVWSELSKVRGTSFPKKCD